MSCTERCALSHYQFETIHPFLDGNGRIGRLLITLYLVSNDLLHKPSLYLSAHLEKHRGAYYDALTRARESNDIGHWVRFFLQAVVETAESGKTTFRRILALRQKLDAEVIKFGRQAEKAKQLITFLYGTPKITVKKTVDLLGIKYVTANNLITKLVDIGILQEITGYQRNRIFIFRRYIDIFKDET